MRWTVATTLLLVGACGGADPVPDTTDSGDGPAAYDVVSPASEAMGLLELEDAEGNAAEMLTIVDQLLVAVDPDATEDAVDALIDAVATENPGWGLRAVGRIPLTGVAQLAFDNRDLLAEEQAARMMDVVARLESEPLVTAAVPNHLLEMSALVEDYSDDNNILEHQDRCAYSVIDYFQAYAVLPSVLRHVPQQDVTVAVIDTEIERGTGEFDEVGPRLTEIDAARPIRTGAGHGTGVAGIIAADHGDDGLNGVALPFLGDHLSMQFVFCDPISYDEISAMVPGADVAPDIMLAPLGNVLAATGRAVAGGADVVNLSFGTARRDGAPPVHIRAMRQMWWDLFTHADARDTLFVAAAPNHPIELTGFNSAPAGLTDPATRATPGNLLTVGGVDSCDPMQRWSRSAHGDLVQAYAPASNVHVVDLGVGRTAARSGNSFAAPFVTSIAAIARSVVPSSMTGAELRDLVLADPASLPMSTGGADVRPTLMFTVGHAVLQHAPSHATVDALIDNLGGRADGVPDPTGWAANRHVMEGYLEVSGPGYSAQQDITSADVVAQGATHRNYGAIDTLSMSLNLSVGEEQMGVSVRHPLQLGQAYTIGGNADILLVADAPDGKFVGNGTAGTLTLRECELTTRSLPMDHTSSAESGPYDAAVYIQFSGELSGTALGDIDSEPRQTDVTYQFAAHFNTTFQLLFPPPAEMERWEQICEGGFTP